MTLPDPLLRTIRRLATNVVRPHHTCARIATITFVFLALSPTFIFGQSAPEAKALELVGYHDLQGRSAYQPTLHRQGQRWIAYIGHHGGSGGMPYNALTGTAESNGTSIVEVTDPRHPVYLHHIPGPVGTNGVSEGAQMTRVCDGKDLPKGDPRKTYLLRTSGRTKHEVYDVSDPARPMLLTQINGLVDTHKSWWECDTGIAYLVSGDPQWRKSEIPGFPPLDLMTKVYDLSDPVNPVFIRDFGLSGQEPGAVGPVPPAVHGMMSTGPRGNRIYFAYGAARSGMLQIVDREKLLKGPKEPSPQNLSYPEVSRMYVPSYNGVHSAFPLMGIEVEDFAKSEGAGKASKFDFVVLTGETLANECKEPRQVVRIVDVTDEQHPVGASTWAVPEENSNFCSRGGRFGPHATNESFSMLFYGKLVFISYFNAGVRVLDVRNPFLPHEVAYYIPAITGATEKRCIQVNGEDRCKAAIQTNNVEVDDRGYVYIVDRANTGLHILKLTGEARKIVGLQSSR
jgi:hypothetical protein